MLTRRSFHGTLSLLDTSQIGMRVHRDDYNYARYASRQRLPLNSSFSLSQVDGALVPVYPGLIVTGDIVWNLFFTTGVAWDEPGGVDGGWTRASVPWALSERNANCLQVCIWAVPLPLRSHCSASVSARCASFLCAERATTFCLPRRTCE